MEQNSRIAVLLVNTGTPEAATPEAVRRYLRDYLKDPRIVEMPPAVWYPILYGMVLSKRPKRSALKYQKIWTEEGSPLTVHMKTIASRLSERFSSAGFPVTVRAAMCYGVLPVSEELPRLLADTKAEKLLVVPFFPQYSPQAAGGVNDNVMKQLMQLRDIPALRTVKRFADRKAWAEAMASHIRAYWEKNGTPFESGGKLFFSYHGVPEECVKKKGDRYQAECLASSEAIASVLGLEDGSWETVFQSRFGPHEWLQPYTAVRTEQVAAEGLPRLDVVVPSFACDCLETLEEIDMEIRGIYESSNPSGSFHYIPCMNAEPHAVQFYEDLIRSELQGWL